MQEGESDKERKKNRHLGTDSPVVNRCQIDEMGNNGFHDPTGWRIVDQNDLNAITPYCYVVFSVSRYEDTKQSILGRNPVALVGKSLCPDVLFLVLAG